MFSCAPALGQEAASIDRRIDEVFEVVPKNPLELAVPLSRRALMRRAAQGTEPGQAASSTIPSSALGGSAEAAPVGSADAPSRLPRPRPTTTAQEPRQATGMPLDLVAGAALPEDTEGDSKPQQLMPAARAPTAALSRAAPTAPERAPAAEPHPQPPLVTAAVQQPQMPPQGSEAGAPAVSPTAATASLPADCLQPTEVADRDGDFARNKAAFEAAGLCITQANFKERRRPWTIQTVHSARPGPLWVVIHDDEATAFDNAVQALKTYGGKFMTVDTGGKRNQDGIDPNRNFSADGIGCAKLGDSASPRFTTMFLKAFDPAQPLIALHNNVGSPIPTGGLGHVAMNTVPKDMRAWRASDRDGELAGNHTLVLLAAADANEPAVQDWAKGLSSRGVNVVVESVTEKTADCSLSNFAVFAGQRNYFNVTVDKDDGDAQRRIVDMIMSSFFTLAAR